MYRYRYYSTLYRTSHASNFEKFNMVVYMNRYILESPIIKQRKSNIILTTAWSFMHSPLIHVKKNLRSRSFRLEE